MTLSLEEMWVKAAVEHRLMYVSYKNPETRLVYNKREVRPELITADEDGKVTLWARLHHNPFVGLKAFSPEFFDHAELTAGRFTPTPDSQWEKLVGVYEEHQLAGKEPDAPIRSSSVVEV